MTPSEEYNSDQMAHVKGVIAYNLKQFSLGDGEFAGAIKVPIVMVRTDAETLNLGSYYFANQQQIANFSRECFLSTYWKLKTY